MQRARLYITDGYGGYGRKYYGNYRRAKRRIKLRETIWKGRAAKCAAVFLTAMLLATAFHDTAGRMFSGTISLEQTATAGAEPVEALEAGNAAFLEEMLAENTAGKEERENPYIEGPTGIPKEREDTLVMLDPGHGGADEGCARNGVQEKEVNLQIALATQIKLQEMGYQVLLTRAWDTGLTLEERVLKANEARADIYVSIHQNASEVAGVEGIEVWYSAQNAGEESARLSELIEKYAVENTGAVGREILEEENLYVIRECAMPSCLVETGFLSNAGERGRLADREYQEQIAEGIASGIDLYFHPKTMYLTFDDGPSPENTATVLDILKERDIKATFFLVGENVERYPEMARRIAAEGHAIGIHCNRHAYQELYRSVDSYVADFEKAREIVREVTGVETKLFRFPGGSINAYNKRVYKDIIAEMTARGYVYYDWNASLEDAVTKPNADTLIQNGVSSTLGRNHVVMLAHDVVYETGQCLDELLDQFPEYRMEPLTGDVEPIQF